MNPPIAPSTTAAAVRSRPVTDNPPLAARTCELLQASRAFVRLDAEEAYCVASYMIDMSYSKGEVIFRAGDRQNANHLLLVIEGEVTVEADSPLPQNAMPIAALGAGSILGEMSLMDGAPRAATCTAVSDVRAAGLGRRGLALLIDEHPRVAAKLLVVLAHGLAERLRALDEQLRMVGQVQAATRR